MDSLLSVVWHEGMFLNPQHFQQNTYYLESYCREIINQNIPNAYGITELIIDESLCHIGKIKVIKAKGIFPDGTPFELNHSLSIDLTHLDSGRLLYLAIPLADIRKQQISDSMEYRYSITEMEIADNSKLERETRNMEFAKLNIWLKKEGDDFSDYTQLPILKVENVDNNLSVSLDNDFIPLCFNGGISRYLLQCISTINTLVSFNASKISNRINNDDYKGTTANKQKDILSLYILNHWLTVLNQWHDLSDIRLKEIYITLVKMANSLLSCEYLVAKPYPTWDPQQRNSLLNKVIDDIKNYLHDNKKTAVTEIALDYHLYSSRRLLRANILDKVKASICRFILEVKSKNGQMAIKERIPAMLKIAGNSDIADRVNNGLSGIDLISIDYPPPEITQGQYCYYFEINKKSELWKMWEKRNELIAIHIDGQIEDISIKLFAIR
nr:type VI secretion system baseplate subunit TssK [uncultured Moellerella sp.]